MVKWLIWISFLVLNFLKQEPIFGQNLSWKNYTTDHGLPGNEIYDQLEDGKGYMWFATNHGICRFNGYEFIQPVDTSHLSGTEAFLPTEDSEGNIWFSRLDGSIWKIENDTIRNWKFNNLIAPYVSKYRPIVKMHIAGNGDVWLAMQIHGFIVVSKTGDVRVINRKDADYFFITETKSEELYTMCYGLSSNKPSDFESHRKFSLLYWRDCLVDSGLKFQVEVPLSGAYLEYLSFPKNEKLICLGDHFFYVKNEVIVWQLKFPFHAGKAYLARNGNVLIPSRGGNMHGLIIFDSVNDLRIGKYSILLKDHYVTRILEDRNGGYWATTHHAGIFYCKNPNLEIFNKETGLSTDDILCLSDDNSSHIYLGTRPAGIIKLHTKLNTAFAIPPPPEISREVNIIFYDKINEKIYGGELLHIYKNRTWTPVGQTDDGDRFLMGFPTKSITKAPNGKSIWLSSFSGFALLHLYTGKLDLFGRDISTTHTGRTFSIVQDKLGQIFVTTVNGLRMWQNNRYELPPFTHPLLKYQPRNILIDNDGNMLFSLSGNGILIRNTKNQWKHLSMRDGLVSNSISKFCMSDDAKIYACASSGLSILSHQNGRWNIVNVTEKDGLPSNQVNDVIKLNGVLWIATNKGLVKLKNLPVIKPIPKPILEKLWVNNKQKPLEDNAKFDYYENDIALRFYALHYRSDGKIPFRFRLSGADSSFTNSMTREVNFANLSSGKYLFQVQAQNEAGDWGEMTEWTFVIQAAWWKTIWFYGIAGFIIAVIIGIWYKEKLRKKQHEFEIVAQIKDLQATALRAQMNPHFIFNSLSSIQHFITENDKDSAIAYLAKFARLVRLALHGSVDGQHTLREEIEMLEYYLSLEQLRFKGKFNFSITIIDEFDPDEISIPPMLLQPFVENALLHGMKNKADGGKIEISFELNESILLAHIKDNGPGIHSGLSKLDVDGHKSVGMTLTKHRLEILSEQSIRESFQIQEIKSDDGKVIGTSVTLCLPLI